MRVQFLATEPHYRDHLRPVYDALPPKLRDVFASNVDELPRRGALTVVSSFGDYRLTTGPAVMFEHGAGFTFEGNHQSFAGGRNKQRVVLFCDTNQIGHERNIDAYPRARHVIVGCPKLDRWVGHRRMPGPKPVVAVSFHWDSRIAPETRWAFPHYVDVLAELQSWGYEVLGHGHPRAWAQLAPVWERYGFELVPTFSEVMERADLYIADATSTLYEFATVGPVVVLNAPWYRRDVDQGLRFWRHVPGLQVDDPKDLRATIEAALAGDGEELRLEAVAATYPNLGKAARTAANAIRDLVRDYERLLDRRDFDGTLYDVSRLSEDPVTSRRIATERIYITLPDGSRKLIAAAGDPIPEGYESTVQTPPPAEPEAPVVKARKEADVEDKAVKPRATKSTRTTKSTRAKKA